MESWLSDRLGLVHRCKSGALPRSQLTFRLRRLSVLISILELLWFQQCSRRQHMMRIPKHLIALTLMLSAAECGGATPVYGYEVVATYPHSTSSYTEGFVYLNGLFYEGTGLKGHSQVLIYEPKSGLVKQAVNLPSEFFGEGIVDWGLEPLRVDVAVQRRLCEEPDDA